MSKPTLVEVIDQFFRSRNPEIKSNAVVSGHMVSQDTALIRVYSFYGRQLQDDAELKAQFDNILEIHGCKFLKFGQQPHYFSIQVVE